MQGPTSKPDNTPSALAPARLPPWRVRPACSSRSRRPAGNCSSKKPNIGRESRTNSPAKLAISQGCISHPCRFAPRSAATTPSAA